MAYRQKQSLGGGLVEQGLIEPEQLKKAEAEAAQTKQPLRKILVKLGMVSEEDMVMFLSNQLGIPSMDLSTYLIDPKIIEIVPEELARKYDLIPLFKIGNNLTCAMADPLNIVAQDEIRLKTGFMLDPVVATEKDIKKAIEEHYAAKGNMDDVIKGLEERRHAVKEGVQLDLKELKSISQEPPIIRLVNLMIMQAIKTNASDIHIEPLEDGIVIRYRIDGVLHEVNKPPKYLQSAIISRIKILANLDIAEHRIPQDGRFNIKMENRDVDIRTSCVPTIYGENVVLRLLDPESVILGLEKLGFLPDILNRYQGLIHRPYGIILVTGPTGSGKTTTLYASLSIINSQEKNIITIEDPVEYHLGGIRQIQINPKVELTFANGLRSILRQDPDIIMVGEIRDLETADIAIHAALTGHLVFSTLHTNDAPGAIARLIDMGVEPFLISSSVIGILAQRLVRIICPDCKETFEPDNAVLEKLGIEKHDSKIMFSRGKGCDKCMHTGYRGRLGIFELMIPNDKIRSLSVNKSPSGELKQAAIEAGMITLKKDGIEKVLSGITTAEEVLRVTQEG
ncbi:MAG: type II secretion system ATPase GspE [Candidatus Omnitrophota bacterium]